MSQVAERDAKNKRSGISKRKCTTPHLEYLTSNHCSIQQVSLERFPFSLGRVSSADLVIPSSQISRLHAEIYKVGDQIRVKDLNSTNGTFRNGKRIQDSPLYHGDILHLAQQEFRFLSEGCENAENLLGKTDLFLSLKQEPSSVLKQLPYLKELLQNHLVRTMFQPIVSFSTRDVVGYEALGRGNHEKISNAPLDLFQLAEQFQMAGELSRVFRTVAVVEARKLPNKPAVFLNMHPSEWESPSTLLNSMILLRRELPEDQHMLLELHEETVVDVSTLKRLRAQLKDIGIGVAYDDFGSGRSRLEELVEVPPDVVKLNRTLVTELQDSPGRQKVVQTIVAVAKELKFAILAEGIETIQEANICQQLGCSLAQGYLMGHPQPAPSPMGITDTWRVAVRPTRR